METQKQNKRGLLIILSGPSGVGKGTVRRLVMADKSLNLHYSVSMTTRSPRDREVNGRDYFFVTEKEFIEHIKNKDFLEYARFVDNYYGTPKHYVDKLLEEGKNVFLEIEVQGAMKAMQLYHGEGLTSIFLVPPSFEELEMRIRHRRSETEEVIYERLSKAQKEMGMKYHYDYCVLNDSIQRAADEIKKIIKQAIKSHKERMSK